MTDNLDQLLENVDRSATGCWVWKRARRSGYGAVWWRGRMDGAHRVVWELHNGPIPEGMQVLHHCDNPPCVRLDHLFLGSRDDNMRDMKAKGRGRGGAPYFGEEHPRAKLTQEQVEDIRRRYAEGGVSLRSLATEYGMVNSTICKIVKGNSWK